MKHPVITVILGFVTVTAFTVLLFAVYTLILKTPQAPIAYAEAEYMPDRRVYAPDDTLTYTPTLFVARPGRIDIVRSFWNRDADAAAVDCNGDPIPSIEIHRTLPASLHETARANIVRIRVPNLPPGNYWIISSASKSDGGESTYQVPFMTATPCRNDR